MSSPAPTTDGSWCVNILGPSWPGGMPSDQNPVTLRGILLISKTVYGKASNPALHPPSPYWCVSRDHFPKEFQILVLRPDSRRVQTKTNHHLRVAYFFQEGKYKTSFAGILVRQWAVVASCHPWPNFSQAPLSCLFLLVLSLGVLESPVLASTPLKLA